ncbi:MAG: bis(5'-nucleosyl)-tetraphosphatase (symmetrical) YqeK [Clostridia bacterium]|nr:bis(5'-nucleosyl)-tetraphosphatase (symmetrical) YqeK [Clostridia bacterium]
MNDLSLRIKKYMSDYRYAHTLSVVEECKQLAKLFKIDSEDLVTAAYLHDITKEMSIEDQIALCKEYKAFPDESYLRSPKTLHSYSAVFLIKKDFEEYAKESVLLAVKNHTTGREDMSLNEKLLYLADYIEPTRRFEDCKAVRKYFYEQTEDIYKRLDETIFISLKMTVSSLLENNEYIHIDTVKAYNRFSETRGK